MLYLYFIAMFLHYKINSHLAITTQITFLRSSSLDVYDFSMLPGLLLLIFLLPMSFLWRKRLQHDTCSVNHGWWPPIQFECDKAKGSGFDATHHRPRPTRPPCLCSEQIAFGFVFGRKCSDLPMAWLISSHFLVWINHAFIELLGYLERLAVATPYPLEGDGDVFENERVLFLNKRM